MAQSGQHFLRTARRSWWSSFRVGLNQEPEAVVRFINDRAGLENDRWGTSHGGADPYIRRCREFLDDTPHVGEERPGGRRSLRSSFASMMLGGPAGNGQPPAHDGVQQTPSAWLWSW